MHSIVVLFMFSCASARDSEPAACDAIPEGLSTDVTALLRLGTQVVKFTPNGASPEQSMDNNIWTHPLALGILLGFLLIGPDHLSTLMALSTLTSGFASFKRGFRWGAGHSIGVMLLCPMFLMLEHITSEAISTETWEHYGDVFIGISMVAVGFFFMYFEKDYLQKRADGTYEAKGCACHGPHGPESITTETLEEKYECCEPSSTSMIARTKLCETKGSERGNDDSIMVWHFGMNSLLGVLQGLCCPVGMTVGTGFMSRICAKASTPMLVAFMVEFCLASGVAGGTITLAWGALTRTGSGRYISGRIVYIGTCMLLLVFGVIWLVAHCLGVLDDIDFVHKIHEKLMPCEATMHF